MQRHPYEWPILAENQWPNHGRKLTVWPCCIGRHTGCQSQLRQRGTQSAGGACSGDHSTVLDCDWEPRQGATPPSQPRRQKKGSRRWEPLCLGVKLFSA
jgi:hypothetical protein